MRIRILFELLLLTWFLTFFAPANLVLLAQELNSNTHRSISGVYPHLAMWNNNGECGTGAVQPWAGKLWVITYSPHFPNGSDDKLYSISPDLEMEIFPGSVGGTPANRMIHRESNQLIIGPYLIDDAGNVRVIGPAKMPGRLTGNARHLDDPKNKIYYATMEEGIYEVDVHSLAVNQLFSDYQQQTGHAKTDGITDQTPLMEMPGYHGKGLYSGQGRLIYANNGESSPVAKKDPKTPSGCLAEWDGQSKNWKLIRRNQFVDVRGPGGLSGNRNPESDPVWAIGWDHRSLLLMLLDEGRWHTYRLPKASHTYDGAHGWNTEWPRFNDVGESSLVMNMHGMFWQFPRSFSLENSQGIIPRSTYLKVIGDYCRWDDQIVFGCDDTAKNEFLNKRKAKGRIKEPGQSHSNLWFTEPGIFDSLGTPLGRGAVWIDEDVSAATPSDPFLFAGFEQRQLCLTNHSDTDHSFLLEIDRQGNNDWEALTTIELAAGKSHWHWFDAAEVGIWLRLSTRNDARATAQFHFCNADNRSIDADLFHALATPESANSIDGIVRVRGNHLKKLALVSSTTSEPNQSGFYELDGDLNLQKVDDMEALEWTRKNAALTTGVLEFDEASVIYIDDVGNRWRLPKHNSKFDSQQVNKPYRVDREVVTERDLFNCDGTFYELPARNAGGIAKIRPICTHGKCISDYCSYRGMLVLSGLDPENMDPNDQHVVVSENQQAALWLGVVDDLWKLNKPIGIGGPWNQSQVEPDEPSDPYLLTGYDRKKINLQHTASSAVNFLVEIDITGTGQWTPYKTFSVPPGKSIVHEFPTGFSGYWLRLKSDQSTIATAILEYY